MSTRESMVAMNAEFKVTPALQSSDPRHIGYVEKISEHLFEEYRELDRDAGAAQKAYLSRLRWMFRLAALAGTCGLTDFVAEGLGLEIWLSEHGFDGKAFVANLHKGCLGFELLAIGAVIFLAFALWKREYLQEWLTKRQCAEVLRSKIVLALAELPVGGQHFEPRKTSYSRCWVNVEDALDGFQKAVANEQNVGHYYQVTQEEHSSLALSGEETRVTMTKRTTTTVAPMPALGSSYASREARTEFVRNSWIREQLLYHRMRARKNEKKHALYEVLSAAIFVLTILLVVIEFFELYTHGAAEVHHSTVAKLKAVLPAASLALIGYSRARQFSHEALRSEVAAEELSELEQELNSVPSEEHLLEACSRAERIMLGELSQWRNSLKSGEARLPG